MKVTRCKLLVTGIILGFELEDDIMNRPLKQTLFWTPRLAGILFILFLSIFALDVFDMQLGFWGTVLALLMHLIPSILLAIAVITAWRWEWVGAVIFIGWAIWYVTSTRGFGWGVYVLIAGLPALIGLLFLAGWVWRKQIREQSR
jgi:hypothetical protein